jgi:hypothetical protein
LTGGRLALVALQTGEDPRARAGRRRTYRTAGDRAMRRLPPSGSQRRYGADMTDSSKITITQLRNETSRIIARIEAGETLFVTRYGRVVAVISPVNPAPGDRRAND